MEGMKAWAKAIRDIVRRLMSIRGVGKGVCRTWAGSLGSIEMQVQSVNLSLKWSRINFGVSARSSGIRSAAPLTSRSHPHLPLPASSFSFVWWVTMQSFPLKRVSALVHSKHSLLNVPPPNVPRRPLPPLAAALC